MVDSKVVFTHRLLVRYPSGKVVYFGADGMEFNTWGSELVCCR